MEKQTYIVTFEGVSPSDANRYAEELRNALLDATADIAVQRKRESPQTQDFGSTLILILGTPAVGAVVTAVDGQREDRSGRADRVLRVVPEHHPARIHGLDREPGAVPGSPRRTG